MQQEPLLDGEVVKALFAPSGPWAVRCGGRVRKRRSDLGFTLQRLAHLSGTTIQTISRIESGHLVPRDRMKAAIAYALALEVDLIWDWPSRQDLFEQAAAS